MLKIPLPNVIISATSQTNMGEVGNVIFVGIVVVFLTLILLIGILYIVGKLFQYIDEGRNKKLEEKKAELSFPTPPMNDPMLSQQETPASNNGIPDEVVAVISAAIACLQPEDEQYVIKSIKPKQTNRSRPLWNQAGISGNISSKL